MDRAASRGRRQKAARSGPVRQGPGGDLVGRDLEPGEGDQGALSGPEALPVIVVGPATRAEVANRPPARQPRRAGRCSPGPAEPSQPGTAGRPSPGRKRQRAQSATTMRTRPRLGGRDAHLASGKGPRQQGHAGGPSGARPGTAAQASGRISPPAQAPPTGPSRPQERPEDGHAAQQARKARAEHRGRPAPGRRE